ncbi:MAG TPA: hypothetical protein VH590_08320 [Ktedonobacterales bacterium]
MASAACTAADPGGETLERRYRSHQGQRSPVRSDGPPGMAAVQANASRAWGGLGTRAGGFGGRSPQARF